MGSPLSPIIANIFMENFEEKALESAPLQPRLWLRYVDDTFIIWPHDRHHLKDFLNHLNSQHPDITFTMEIEQHNSIPFLDTLISKPESGPIQHQVYRKPTHTDRYLHYRSFHHPSVTQSVANTLVRRAYTISDQHHLQNELAHIKTALQENGYPSHKIRTTPPTQSHTTADPSQATVIISHLLVQPHLRFNAPYRKPTSKFDTAQLLNFTPYFRHIKTRKTLTPTPVYTEFPAIAEKFILERQAAQSPPV